MNSFSQGIFVFKNGLHGKPDKKKKAKYPIPQTVFDCADTGRLWNNEFERTWGFVRSKVDEIQANNNDGHLAELCDFVTRNDCSSRHGAINDPTNANLLRVAALLTGINKPDHHLYFKLLASTMNKKKVARTVFLPARDCPNVRTAMETLVSCLLSNGRKHNYRDEDIIENMNAKDNGLDDSGESCSSTLDSDDDEEPPVKLRRSQYTLEVLQSWYDAKFLGEAHQSRPQLAVIMPNFEEFKPAIVKDLIQILSNHCERLPFVLILGVATSTTTLMNTLSITETTRIKLRVFSGQPPNQILDQILDNVILTPKCPFQVSSRLLEYLKGVFIYYDLTAKNFLRSVNYCLLDQYSHGNAYSICSTTFAQAKKNISRLDHADCEMIRRLPSFRPYIERLLSKNDPIIAKQVIGIFKDDELFRNLLIELVRDVYAYFLKFYGYIRVLWTLVKDLPNSPMGKRLSDVYMYCQSSEKNVTTTEQFERCWQMLAMLSRNEFISVLKRCHKSLEEYETTYCNEKDDGIDEDVRNESYVSFDATFTQLQSLIDELGENQMPVAPEEEQPTVTQQPKANRTNFYQNILKQKKSKTGTTNSTRQALDFLRFDVFEKNLPSREKAPPLLELFVYSDWEQIQTHLRGASRSAIHKALIDPHHYLECDCCAIQNRSQLLPSMPDNCITYGLLLESGQQVNIYDWMSAFNAIVGEKNAETSDDDSEDDGGDIPPEIQARFTRARAELHFMGFTKNSKRKTDHVTRTTW